EAMITLIVTERQKVDPAFTELRLLEDLDDKKLINRSNETVGLNGLGLLDIMHTVVLRPRQITRTAPQ
ncbi:hypothetical protein MJO13_18165, partial [Salmonella enterica subsp. enterica serovar Lubbock]|nr:hypothetical protein [Salmonella enterica subsp. enterica serovar Lubbock]